MRSACEAFPSLALSLVLEPHERSLVENLKWQGGGGPTIPFIQSSPQKRTCNPTWNSRGHPLPQFHFEGGEDL